MKLQEYNMPVKHQNGTEQGNADFMSHLAKLADGKKHSITITIMPIHKQVGENKNSEGKDQKQ